jgi:hypothetical protein
MPSTTAEELEYAEQSSHSLTVALSLLDVALD